MSKFTYGETESGWVVIGPNGQIICTTHLDDRGHRAEHLADLLNGAGIGIDRLHQGELALEALGRLYDAATRLSGKFAGDDAVLDEIERVREIAGATLYQIYRAPHLKPERATSEG